MRIPSLRLTTTRAISGLLLAIGIGALVMSATPAFAQGGAVSNQQTVGAVRLGLYLPLSSSVTGPIGKWFPAGGLDYTFSQTANSRAQVDLDYIERSSSGSTARVIPLTVSEQYYSGARDFGVRPYWGLGLGVYFVHVSVPNPDTGASVGNPGVANVSGTSSVLGGFLNAGLEFPENFFVDARYHQVSEVEHVNTSGFEFTVGYRF